MNVSSGAQEFVGQGLEQGQGLLNEGFVVNWRGTPLNIAYVQAAAIVGLLFLLVLTFARLRRMYVHWSIKGASGMIAMGFILALILEGFFILGGRTLFTELVGLENTPKPISIALDAGRNRLVDVLGVTEEIPESVAKNYSSQEVVRSFQSLSSDEADAVRSVICSP